jgi:hypothetical protein
MKPKKYLQSWDKTPQLLIKFEPFVNLNSLRENMLYEIRKNYISKEELFNSAHKQYNFWTNLAIEDIKNIIKKNSPDFNHQIILPRDAISIHENFH